MFSNLPAKVLIFGIIGLSFYISIITAWNTNKIEKLDVKLNQDMSYLPKEYVRLERYLNDLQINRYYLERIENKLDTLVTKKEL